MTGVVVYTSTDCPTCKLVKAELKDHGVEFEERNIDDVEHYLSLLMLNCCTVPTIVRDGVVVELKEVIDHE